MPLCLSWLLNIDVVNPDRISSAFLLDVPPGVLISVCRYLHATMKIFCIRGEDGYLALRRTSHVEDDDSNINIYLIPRRTTSFFMFSTDDRMSITKPNKMTYISLLLFALLVVRTSGHGLISWPRQRGLLSSNNYGLKVLNPEAPSDYCPHCLNGGGPGTVKLHTPDGKWTPYEPTIPSFRFRDDHGLCGDPKGNKDHMYAGKFYAGLTIATYEQGDFIDMEAHVSAHHNGYFEFFACSLDCCKSNDLSKACFVHGCCKKMLRVPNDSCESGGDRVCGPIDPRYPGRWYLPPRDEQNPENNWYGGMNEKMRYSLPKDMTCDKCLIHWAWTTANTCNPPGYADYNFPTRWNGIPGDGGSTGGINRGFATCGTVGSFPEEFWSCSENIRITKKNGGKHRSVQTFHDGETNINRPHRGDVFLPSVTEPEKKPVAVPSPDEMPKMKPIPKTVPTPGDMDEDHIVGNEGNNENPAGKHPRTGTSSYNLTKYITSYDSRICVQAKGYMYCQACLDLGYGVSKCFWCTKYEGKEACLHEKP